ncbi:MAG TPA: ion transporter [Poseidonia sp.]|nr:ion transporter [Poseidonia sp.]
MAEIMQSEQRPLKERIHRVIFEAESPSGKFFDVALLIAIIASIVAVSLESVDSIDKNYHAELRMIEWIITILFTLEYLLRLYSTKKSQKYATSFFGMIDLIAILPTYLSLIIPGAQSLLVLRAMRLLRMFRVLKLSRYIDEGEVLIQAISQSRTRIIIFLFTVTILGFISGAMMYLLEGPTNGFTSIPQSVYWSLTTITGTGYGDTVPSTPMGKFLAVAIMVLGYSLIIVPTGIVSSELIKLGEVDRRACNSCSKEGHDKNAKHCKFCGETLLVS